MHSRKMSAMLGDIVSVLAVSPSHRNLRVSDLTRAVLPALASGQYKIALGQDEITGYSRPVATVLWARVSSTVDQRLAANIAAGVQIAADEWISGDTLWIVEAAGSREALIPLFNDLRKGAWGTSEVKYRTLSTTGLAVVGVLGPQMAS